MPRVREPESDQSRLQLLSKAVKTALLDDEKNLHYLPADLPGTIATFLADAPAPAATPGYQSAVATLTRDRAALSKEVDEAEKADAALETWMRDFWEVLRRRTFRLGHAAAVLNFYDLAHDGETPAIGNRADRYT